MRKTFRKIIVTEDTLKNINPENKKLQKQFLQHKSLSASPTTIKGYGSDLDIFFSYLYLEQENLSFIELKKFDLISFFTYAKDELQFGSSRSNRLRSTLSSMSIFIESVLDDQYSDFKNIVLSAVQSVPKSPEREKTVFTDEEVEDMIRHFEKDDLQIATWISLAAYSGARLSELLRINTKIIEESKEVFDGILLETTPIKSKGRGINGVKNPKYIVKDNFMPIYEKWLIERAKRIKQSGADEHDAIFIKKNGQPATKSTVRGFNKKSSDYIGKTVYSHSFRHYLVSLLVRRGIPQNVIIALLSWKSGGAMIQIYDDNTVTDMEVKELESLRL